MKSSAPQFGSCNIKMSWKRLLPLFSVILLLAVPLIVGKLWVYHAYEVKLSGALTQKLASVYLTEWNFGTVEQRLDVDNWTRILDRIRYWVCPKFMLLLPLAAFLGFTKKGQQSRLFLATSVVGVAIPIVVFFNLYVIHDYYLIAVTPLLAIFMGFSLSRICFFCGSSQRGIAPSIGIRRNGVHCGLDR